jgi:multisubunit Na+/H+ antiporter MnhG subunit
MSTRDLRSDIPLTGWSAFAAAWLVIAGAFNIVSGATAVHRSNSFEGLFLFSSLSTWGWILLIIGIVQLVAGWLVFTGSSSGYTMGMVIAMVAAFIWFFFVFTAPVAMLVGVILNGLVIYGLSIGSARAEGI